MTKQNAFLDQAKKYEKQMVKFLRDMVAIPSESAEEGPVIQRIKQEMEATGAYDKIWVDGLGNLLGYVGKPGKGKKLIAIDAHVDWIRSAVYHETSAFVGLRIPTSTNKTRR